MAHHDIIPGQREVVASRVSLQCAFFRPVLCITAAYHLVLWWTMFYSEKAQAKQIDEWLDARLSIGEDPFDKTWVYKTRASSLGIRAPAIDDSDYNNHLNNSSYAKICTHFIYLKENPMMAEYEVRTSLASWDQKWNIFSTKHLQMFILHRFVSKGKGKPSNHQVMYNEQCASPEPQEARGCVLQASLFTQANATPATIPNLLALHLKTCQLHSKRPQQA
ncbi:hypothetical protein NP233_g3830 [Leucocoprinus birnbaumii]|uniref:Uncharacterized protein n=1 Tax=Leucocoprinus birnbaumii TaxID=56174 RepID=A0AAD5YSG1_9AGAR|nr:hypothetical protein NP233_g3830 [Leucocoprinus birnbaumii]